MDAVFSSSWPAVTAKPRQTNQPPRAPLRGPSPVSWEVPPFNLAKSPKQGFCCGSSDTTIGDGCVGGSFTASCDFSDDEDEPCMFSLEEYTGEEDRHEEGASLYDMCMVGLEESFGEEPALNDESASNEIALGASPMLLSALAQVKAEVFAPKALLQAPKAPLLKPSPAPFEVPYFELPESCANLDVSLASER